MMGITNLIVFIGFAILLDSLLGFREFVSFRYIYIYIYHLTFTFYSIHFIYLSIESFQINGPH